MANANRYIEGALTNPPFPRAESTSDCATPGCDNIFPSDFNVRCPQCRGIAVAADRAALELYRATHAAALPDLPCETCGGLPCVEGCE